MNWSRTGYLKNVPVDASDFPPALAEAYGKGQIPQDSSRWHLNVLRAYGVNRDNSIASWTSDIFFATIPAPVGSPLPMILAGILSFLILVGLLVLARRKTARA